MVVGTDALSMRKKAVEKAILAGVRATRTTMHASLSMTSPEEPSKALVEAPPLPKPLRTIAVKLLQTRAEISEHRKAVRDARLETQKSMDAAAAIAIEFVRRIQLAKKNDTPVNITVDYEDGQESDKFRLNIKQRQKKRGLPAKEFAEIVAKCIQQVDSLEGEDWKADVASRIAAAVEDAILRPAADEDRQEPRAVLRAVLKRKREHGQVPPGAYGEDEDGEEDEEGEEEEEEEEDYE